MAKKDEETQEMEVAAPPWVRYEKASVEQILARCKKGGKGLRRRVLEWEQAHQNRKEIVEPLVNWAS